VSDICVVVYAAQKWNHIPDIETPSVIQITCYPEKPWCYRGFSF